MARALVLGGGGHIGSAIARVLTGRGWRVAVATLRPGERANLAGLDVDRLVGDDTADADLETWISGAALVVDAASPYALDLHDPETGHNDRVAAAEARMRRILNAAAATGARLIHIGSFLNRADLASAGFRSRIVRAAHPYFRIKKRLAELARDAARNGQPVMAVNPASCLGPGNLRPPNHSFVASVLSGEMPFSYPDVINVMDARDVAEGVVRAEESGWHGGAVDLSGTNVSVHDLTEMIARVGEVPTPPRSRALAAGAATLYGVESAAA
ncbi:MAG: NAD-dependent epimerase/dehydratase family protein, partial [Pseudomonadota bacterium]